MRTVRAHDHMAARRGRHSDAPDRPGPDPRDPDDARESIIEDVAEAVGLLDRIRANRAGRIALRLGVGILGVAIVALGIVLIPFPGPGWLIVIAGLAVLALEFVWAKRLLMFTRRTVSGWTRWVGRQSWPVRLAVGLAGLVFVAVVVWVSVRLTFGVDLVREFRDQVQ